MSSPPLLEIPGDYDDVPFNLKPSVASWLILPVANADVDVTDELGLSKGSWTPVAVKDEVKRIDTLEAHFQVLRRSSSMSPKGKDVGGDLDDCREASVGTLLSGTRTLRAGPYRQGGPYKFRPSVGTWLNRSPARPPAAPQAKKGSALAAAALPQAAFDWQADFSDFAPAAVGTVTTPATTTKATASPATELRGRSTSTANTPIGLFKLAPPPPTGGAVAVGSVSRLPEPEVVAIEVDEIKMMAEAQRATGKIEDKLGPAGPLDDSDDELLARAEEKPTGLVTAGSPPKVASPARPAAARTPQSRRDDLDSDSEAEEKPDGSRPAGTPAAAASPSKAAAASSTPTPKDGEEGSSWVPTFLSPFQSGAQVAEAPAGVAAGASSSSSSSTAAPAPEATIGRRPQETPGQRPAEPRQAKTNALPEEPELQRRLQQQQQQPGRPASQASQGRPSAATPLDLTSYQLHRKIPGTVSFRVNVAPPYPGVQFRKTKSLSDRYNKYAQTGEIVAGTVEDNGKWLKMGKDLYLPIMLNEVVLLQEVKKEDKMSSMADNNGLGWWWAWCSGCRGDGREGNVDIDVGPEVAGNAPIGMSIDTRQ
eukprot:TRINITY_DN12599_c0_g1_i1.p1 TRINITY_DN12599_c0_g1~~TRINITY_DN12599_c0_g1_i1.p1  ORF type:complete len:593 (+),score=149.60 TRINITY_DN12599_c0_g1_i1:81-1859(+)